MNARIATQAGSAVLLVLALAGCGSQAETVESKPDTRIKIAWAPVTRMDMTDTLTIFGSTALRREAFVGSQFDGRLTGFSLLLGDQVKDAQLLGEIVPAGREALLQIADQVPEQQQTLLRGHIQTISLRSPMDGVVLEVLHHTGDVVQKGEQIAHLGDLSELDVRGDLPIRDLVSARQAARLVVCFTDYPHAPISLPLEAIAGSTNPDNQTIVIRAKLPNPSHEFRPGMLARLSFPALDHHAALTIPRSALLEEEGEFSAFVLEGNKVKKRMLRIGILHDDRAEVLSGLADGDRVVTEKAYSLENDMEVSVQ